MRVSLYLLLWSLAASPPALAADEVPVTLELSAERRVSSLQVDELRRNFELAFARSDCPVELVSPADEPAGAPELTLRVHLDRWRERNTPGGAPIFDPSTGRERPGFRREIEVRYRVTVTRAGEEEPLYDKERRVRKARGTTPSIAYDPLVQARREATDWVIRESLQPLCKQARRVLKDSN